MKSSPRSWGCFQTGGFSLTKPLVFPTLVGVFLPFFIMDENCNSLPHARGGVSFVYLEEDCDLSSSPRSWGCFPGAFVDVVVGRVFPTLVGVFPGKYSKRHRHAGLPHARGGVSVSCPDAVTSVASSPRSWGCFRMTCETSHHGTVFPTLVGVFPTGTRPIPHRRSLPHARGGVSATLYAGRSTVASSPRSWGCFVANLAHSVFVDVFPTLVGVFPSRSIPTWKKSCLPHARGGVSKRGSDMLYFDKSSPRSWGCFHFGSPATRCTTVFPTLVGVFPRLTRMALCPRCLPHARGGVSVSCPDAVTSVASSPRSWGCFCAGGPGL